MNIISHRGNINGRDIENENHPSYINNALNKGFDCEIDVWYKNNQFYLGHDDPTYLISKDYLVNDKLWCHAKNIEALYEMLNNNIHCFFHLTDDVTLTSRGYMWTFIGKKLTKLSIAVLPELYPEQDLSICYGICSDNINKYI